jgi:hypothetical protein
MLTLHRVPAILVVIVASAFFVPACRGSSKSGSPNGDGQAACSDIPPDNIPVCHETSCTDCDWCSCVCGGATLRCIGGTWGDGCGDCTSSASSSGTGGVLRHLDPDSLNDEGFDVSLDAPRESGESGEFGADVAASDGATE